MTEESGADALDSYTLGPTWRAKLAEGARREFSAFPDEFQELVIAVIIRVTEQSVRERKISPLLEPDA